MAAAVDLPRRFVSELIGTALLLAVVVGSGIMGDALAKGNDAVALLANTLSTGAGLYALILAFGPISGAHLNPVVTVADASCGGVSWRDVPHYLVAQVAGAFGGVALAHVMFDKPLFSASTHARSGVSQVVAEIVATFGLVGVIHVTARKRSKTTALAVAAWITSAFWFTSSTSFANPAVALARSATSTFAGIRFEDVPGFVIGEVAGGAAAVLFFRWVLR